MWVVLLILLKKFCFMIKMLDFFVFDVWCVMLDDVLLIDSIGVISMLFDFVV